MPWWVLMSLRIYNSLSRCKEDFVPRVAGQVKMYVCGMTVYDYCHLGHARVLVVFDTVARYLRSCGFDVEYVRNITDIDDKIIARAAELGEDIDSLTGRFIEAMHEDCQLLNVQSPNAEPRATDHVDAIIDMIKGLENKEYAYQGVNGDVYYRVRAFADYGRLSGRSLDELQVGARVTPDESKNDPLDFVLWKAAKPGEPSWDSPWGTGRPGWHIECSAMSTTCLGNSFDIHGGGMDLRFPHHENEIAQSEGATGQKFVSVWMHNGYVQIDQEKMSKSLGNFFTIREILGQDDNAARMGEVIRYMILSSHYRSAMNFGPDSLAKAKASLERLYFALAKVADPVVVEKKDSGGLYSERFSEAMDDDFNTPAALAVLFELVRELNRCLDENRYDDSCALGACLRRLGAVLGLLRLEPAKFLGVARDSCASVNNELTAATIKELLSERQRARATGDWKRADEIRDYLGERGILLEDASRGETTWRRR